VATANFSRTPFEWTVARERAASMVADDELTDKRIAAEVGVTERTLDNWKKHPDFRARVDEIVQRLGRVAERYTVSRRAARLAWLQKRHDALDRLIAERAADPSMANVPGGTTGLLVRTVKVVGGGEHARQVEEYRVDTGLLEALLRLEKQAAIEAGQWVTKGEVREADGQPRRSVLPEIGELRKLPPEELVRLHREMLALPGPDGTVVDEW
jgi:hypothetical protein